MNMHSCTTHNAHDNYESRIIARKRGKYAAARDMREEKGKRAQDDFVKLFNELTDFIFHFNLSMWHILRVI